jgi:hypothetical protein
VIVIPIGRLNVTSAAIAACLGLTASTPALAQQAVQWRVEDGGNGHWYGQVAISGPLSRTLYLQASASRGATPVAFSSQAEELFVYGRFGQALIGLAAGPGTNAFLWLAEPFNSYSNWGVPSCPSGPYPNNWPWTNERFAQLQSANCPGTQGIATKWDDYGFNEYPSPVILLLEWSADCNGDGIVDYGQILDGTFEDANENGVPDCCDAGESCTPCPGDVNDSGIVNGTDIAIILGAWGTSGGKFPRSDTDGNGIVDAADLAVVLGGWGNCP